MPTQSSDNRCRRIDNGNKRNDNGNYEHGKREKARGAEQRDRSQQQAKLHRTGIAHENARGIKVVDEKSSGDGNGYDRKQRGIKTEKRHKHYEQRKRGDCGNARRKPIETVNKVDDIHKAHKIENGDGIGPYSKFDDLGRKGGMENVEQGSSASDDTRSNNLAQEFDDRAYRVDIVDNANTHNKTESNDYTDYLSIDDYYKVYAYTCLYKADTGKTDKIKIDGVTMTLQKKMLQN